MSQQTQQAMDGAKDCPPIDKNMVWVDTVGGSYKNCIYNMGTYYTDSVSASSMSVSRASVGGFAVDDEVREMVFKLNAKLQIQAQWVKEQEHRHVQEKSELVKQLTDQIKTLKKESKQDKKMLRREMMDLLRQMEASGSTPMNASSSDSSDVEDHSGYSFFFFPYILYLNILLCIKFN